MTFSPTPLSLLIHLTHLWFSRLYFPGGSAGSGAGVGGGGRKEGEEGTFDGITVNCLGRGCGLGV